eukprot:comp20449_c0_seq2/m.26008 comp20449_c0_seq2/g.26008  ORF comp20449_c0_seq2/g.26008 comp20449_c0_seq2/m.26008 type:complete len:162 (-) comp20449_c0_seq2:48-533(-)
MKKRKKREEEEEVQEEPKKTTKRGKAKPEDENENAKIGKRTRKGKGSIEDESEDLDRFFDEEKHLFSTKFWNDVTGRLNVLVKSYERKMGSVAIPVPTTPDSKEYQEYYSAKQCRLRWNELEQQKMVQQIRETQNVRYDREMVVKDVLEEFETASNPDHEK